jgi:hypothetical protein
MVLSGRVTRLARSRLMATVMTTTMMRAVAKRCSQRSRKKERLVLVEDGDGDVDADAGGAAD